MHELHARIDAMETTQRRIVDAGNINKDESENEAGDEGEEVVVEDATDECLFWAIVRKQRWIFPCMRETWMLKRF